MGDVRYRPHYDRLVSAPNRGRELKAFETIDLVRALAAASEDRESYLANVIATELEGRLSRSTLIPDSSPRRILRVSLDGNILHANAAASQFWTGSGNGSGPRRLVGAPWVTGPWWSPGGDVRERVADALDAAARGTVVHISVPIANGATPRDIEVSLTPVHTSATGRVESVIVEARDPRETRGELQQQRDLAKANEEALRNSQQELATFLDSLTTFTAHLAPTGVIIHVGAQSNRVVGAQENPNLRGLIWQDAPWWTFDATVHATVKAAFEKAARGERVRFAAEALGTNGRRLIDNTLSPVTNGQGVVTSIVVEGRDVTDDKRREDALAAERRRLARVNEDLIAFSYTVTHDLKAPLRGIQAYSRALLEDHSGELSNRAQSLVTSVTAEADRMAVIIQDLLRLAETTGTTLHRQRIDLSILALAVAAELNSRETDRAVSFVIEPDMRAEADPTLVRILLQNLMGNAWKFSKSAPVARIAVGVTRTVGGDVFFVGDNGVGFESSAAQGLFLPFKRFHARADYEGTGVGLATVRRIVEAHSGRVWAESQPGQGATFRFTLAPSSA